MNLRERWQRTPSAIRKPLILLAGCVVVLVGMSFGFVPLIPGWPLVFLGFAILATEFVIAEKVRDHLVAAAKRTGRWLCTKLKRK